MSFSFWYETRRREQCDFFLHNEIQLKQQIKGGTKMKKIVGIFTVVFMISMFTIGKNRTTQI